jgi:hypothetical protein
MIDKNKKYTYNGCETHIYEQLGRVVYFRWFNVNYNEWVPAACFESQLKEVNPYQDMPIDTPGYAWNDEDNKLPRYFAGISPHGKTLVWMYGATSFSSDGKKTWFDNFEPLSPIIGE